MDLDDCPHTDRIEDVTPDAGACQVCDREAPIRVCATCGFVGCCESFGAHDTDHFEETGHPIIHELPLTDDSFTWCYGCGDYLEA